MKIARWVAAAVVVALLGSVALANGAAVLDQMQAARDAAAVAVTAAETRLAAIEVELDTAAGAEKKALKSEKGNLRDGVKQAGKAIDKLDEGIEAFIAHDMKTFLKRLPKATKSLRKARTKGAPDFGLAEVDVTLAETLGTAVAEAEGAVDTSDSRDAKAVEKSASKRLKGDSSLADGKTDKAVDRYVSAFKKIDDLPVAIVGDHRPIPLRALNGKELSLGLAVAPYSPKQTCGECHDYGLITEGYHFDQGQRDISDTYAQDVLGGNAPDYVLSDGMFGRW